MSWPSRCPVARSGSTRCGAVGIVVTPSPRCPRDSPPRPAPLCSAPSSRRIASDPTAEKVAAVAGGRPAEDGDALIIATSGTTGRPTRRGSHPLRSRRCRGCHLRHRRLRPRRPLVGLPAASPRRRVLGGLQGHPTQSADHGAAPVRRRRCHVGRSRGCHPHVAGTHRSRPDRPHRLPPDPPGRRRGSSPTSVQHRRHLRNDRDGRRSRLRGPPSRRGGPPDRRRRDHLTPVPHDGTVLPRRLTGDRRRRVVPDRRRRFDRYRHRPLGRRWPRRRRHQHRWREGVAGRRGAGSPGSSRGAPRRRGGPIGPRLGRAR